MLLFHRFMRCITMILHEEKQLLQIVEEKETCPVAKTALYVSMSGHESDKKAPLH